MHLRITSLFLIWIALSGCSQSKADAPRVAQAVDSQTATTTSATAEVREHAAATIKLPQDAEPMEMAPGVASLSCDYDYFRRTDVPITTLDEEALDQIVTKCAAENMIHLYYRGEIRREFA